MDERGSDASEAARRRIAYARELHETIQESGGGIQVTTLVPPVDPETGIEIIHTTPRPTTSQGLQLLNPPGPFGYAHCYTTGFLQMLDHPELLIIGTAPADLMAAVLVRCVSLVTEASNGGMKLEAGHRAEIFTPFIVKASPVDPRWHELLCSVGLTYHETYCQDLKRPFEVLQLLMPDHNQRYPDDIRFANTSMSHQPLLSDPTLEGSRLSNLAIEVPSVPSKDMN